MIRIKNKSLLCKLLFYLPYFLITFSSFTNLKAQDSLGFFETSKQLNTKRIATVAIGETVGYTGVIIGLNQLWYKKYPKSSFHFFNDNNEWLQMDKVGHGVTGYYVGKVGYELLKWGGVKNLTSVWLGGNLGLIFLTSIEIMDGFSSQWGASIGDVIANCSGSALFITQQLAWKEQRFLLKFSASGSPYAQHRPEILGTGFSERLFKDYNGQTYWLSVNMASFLNNNSKIPKWLNLALGYGVDGLLGGSSNPILNEKGEVLPNFRRTRQYYLSLDVDLTRIKTKSPFINTLLGSIGYLKFPFPAIEITDQNRVFFRGIVF